MSSPVSLRHLGVIVALVGVASGLALRRAAYGGQESQLRLDGWGPISVGMTSAQLEAAAGDRILYELRDEIAESHLTAPGAGTGRAFPS